MIILLLLLLGFDRAQTRPDSWLDLTVYHMMEWLHLSYPSLQPPHHSCLSLSHTHTHIQKKKKKKTSEPTYPATVKSFRYFPFPSFSAHCWANWVERSWEQDQLKRKRRRKESSSSVGYLIRWFVRSSHFFPSGLYRILSSICSFAFYESIP